MHICARGDNQEKIEPRNEPLHNFTGNKYVNIWKNAHFWGVSWCQRAWVNNGQLYSIEFVRLITGQ